jgi:hypothetical protein
MQQSMPQLGPTRLTINPTTMLSLIQKVAEHNRQLGYKQGYRRGRLDEREGRPYPREMKLLP